MGKLFIYNSDSLKGTIKISGAKNSVLPIIAASLLGEGESIIEDVPELIDVNIMCNLIKSVGADVNHVKSQEQLRIKVTDIVNSIAPYELVNKMRASILVMGPLLARTGRAAISLPGGCAIGSRPVDLHLKGFASMGAIIRHGFGYIEAEVKGRLKGSLIYLDFPSVGATENIIMAAVLAEGMTVIENAASEPEIVDLTNYLVSMGANIKGAGTDTIRVYGVKALKGTRHAVIPDRIEAGTFMTAAAITGGEITVENIVPDHLKPVCAKLREAGVEISEEPFAINVKAKNSVKAIDVKTHSYPGFPTDMQAQITALMSIANGTSIITETIFENRFMHIAELKRMGAKIKVEGRSAIIEGIIRLQGAQVRATDLRAGAALVLAGLVADGVTEITDIEHIDRGYFEIDKKLNSLGANITRK